MNVRFEHFQDGSCLGIGDASPRVSWQTLAYTEGWFQAKYEMQVLDANHETVFSGTTSSSESVLIQWPCNVLKSKERAYVRIRVWGKEDKDSSPWSELVYVETGLLNRHDWTGELVCAPQNADDESEIPETLFRKAFTSAHGQQVTSARLYSLVQGIYEVEINGKRVGDEFLSPGWTSYDHRILQQVHDVTAHLQQDSNVIGYRVGNGWFTGRVGHDGGKRNLYGQQNALLAQLEISYTDGVVQVISTDDSWKTASGPIRMNEIYDGETYDANYEIADWSSHSMNEISSWKSVQVLPFPKASIELPSSPPVRHIETVKAISIIKTPSGKSIVDFGQNLVGILRMKSSQAPKGHQITLIHAEVLDNEEIGTRPLRQAAATDSYIFKGDENGEEFEPRFTYHGFRYAQVDNWYGKLELDSFVAKVCHTDFQQTGWFSTSNALVNKLHENIIWSMRGNFVGLPTDCPQRDERLGWTGDIAVFSPTAAFLYQCTGLLCNWLKDLSSEQHAENGRPAIIAPNVLKKMNFGDGGLGPNAVWQDAAIIVPWSLYLANGDTKILRDQYESMERWMESIPKDKDGVFWKEGFQFADWLDPSAPPDQPDKGMTDPQLVANAYLVHMYDLMGTISSLLGDESKSEAYRAQHKVVEAAFLKTYVKDDGKMTSDSQTAYSLALQFHILPEKQKKQAAERLAEIVQKAKYRISTGFAGTPIICDALTDTGHMDLAYKMLLEEGCPSWLYPVTMGATTVWERWDSMLPDGRINPGSMTSFNHYALGAVADWMHRRIGGIEPIVPGWKMIKVHPRPGGGLTEVNVKHFSPYGEVSCHWESKGGVFDMDVSIPANTEAQVILPDGTRHTIGSCTKSYSCKLK